METPAPRGLEASGLFQGPGGQRIGPPSFGCTGDFVQSQANRTCKFKWGLSLSARLYSIQSSSRTQACSGSRDRIASHVGRSEGAK